MIEVVALQLLLRAVSAWLDRRERDALAYLIEENRILRAQLSGRRLRLTDEVRRRLAQCGHRLGRRLLGELATIVTPDTVLRWQRRRFREYWTQLSGRSTSGRPPVNAEITALVRKIAAATPLWGASITWTV